MLLNVVIIYTSIVFGTQHYLFIRSLLQIFFPDATLEYLDIAGFAISGLFFLIISSVLKSKIYSIKKTPKEGSCGMFLVNAALLLFIIWLLGFTVLKSALHIDPDFIWEIHNIFGDLGWSGGIAFLAKTENFFHFIIDFWTITDPPDPFPLIPGFFL